jgi:hypothetical protein
VTRKNFSYITWSLSHPQEASFCFVRVQQEALIQGKLAYTGERPLSTDLVLLKLIQELRQEYPVRDIANTALLTMILGIVSRAAIDQAAFGAVDRETRVQHILEVCLGVLFRVPVPLPVPSL